MKLMKASMKAKDAICINNLKFRFILVRDIEFFEI